MSIFTREQLDSRNIILQSQKLFGSFLDRYSINKIIQLFDNTRNIPKIVKYVEAERLAMGLKTTNIHIKSELDIHNKDDITLHMRVMKNNKELLHLSMHFYVKSLTPQESGVLHFYKNIYRKTNENKSKKALRQYNKQFYALILVHQPEGKQNSLEFSVVDEYTMPGVHYIQTFDNIKTQKDMDNVLQQEMDAIIRVLNRIFDETQPEYYVGKTKTTIQNTESDIINTHKSPLDIHLKTNYVLENINKFTNHVTRKNKGSAFFPKATNEPLLSNTAVKKTKRNNRRTTRKIQRPLNMNNW